MLSYYRESEENEHAVIADRGYHLITEQSHFPGGRLPEDFHLASDQPAKVIARVAPSQSAQISQLNQLVRQYHMDCYYVPYYLREGEAAPAAARDERFAALLQQHNFMQAARPGLLSLSQPALCRSDPPE